MADQNLNMITLFKERLIKTIQVRPLLDHMISLGEDFKEKLRKETNMEAARMLVEHLIRGPRERDWFEELVRGLKESENTGALMYVGAEELPSEEHEVKNDYCEELLRFFAWQLVDKFKPDEMCVRLYSKGCLSAEDKEIIQNVIRNSCSQDGSRELLRRITKKKDWFPTLVDVLHEMEKQEDIIEELTGVPYEEFKAGWDSRRRLEETTRPCRSTDIEMTSDQRQNEENRDEAHDIRQHQMDYAEGPAQQADCNKACDPLDGSDCKMEVQGAEGNSASANCSQSALSHTESSASLDDESTERAPRVITLRNYQMEVATPALEGKNIIACLPTGSGKTRVAVYITRQHLDKRKKEGHLAKAIILVNKVPLVEQHFCSEFNPYLKDRYRVAKICGDSQLKISFPRVVKQYDVIICTAQILENSLIEAAKDKTAGVSLSDFSLLIIDECHHTDKEGVYNNIMLRYIRRKLLNEKYVKTDEPEKVLPLPQVLGLTASPGVGKAKDRKRAEEHILRICANLDSRIMTVQKYLSELQKHVKLPEKKVNIAEDTKKNPFGDKLKDMMIAIEDFGQLFPASEHGTQSYEQWVIQKEKTAAKEGNRKQHVCAEHLRKYNDALQINDTIRMNDALNHLETFYDDERKKMIALRDNEDYTIDPTDHFLITLFDKNKEGLSRLAANEENENGKLAKLRRELMEEFSRNGNSRGIVFTKTRLSADSLCRWIKDNEKFKDVGIRVHYLIGAGGNSDFTAMTQNEQRKVIQKFSTGELNLLIATSVAEEGLDIPECNIVIIYGRITNEIAMMQARGRARAENSKLVVLASNTSGVAEHDSVNEYREEMMYKAIETVQAMSQEDFIDKIRGFQMQNINEKNMKKKKNMRAVYQQNPSMVTFLCRKCHKHVFSGSDIQVIERMHHIISDPKFKQLFKKGENKNLQKFADYQTNGEIFCKACGRTWGTMMVHNGLDLPCLRINNFVIKYKDAKLTNDTLDIWSELPIKFPEYKCSVFDIDDLGEDDE